MADAAEKPVAIDKSAKATKGKKPKTVKAAKDKKPKATKAAPTHPPYVEMIKAAIVALKEKTGSSPQAIHKFISAKYPGLPGNWDKTMKIQLKNLVNTGKLVKVKSSFKLGDDLKKAVKKVTKVSESKAPKVKKTKPAPAKKDPSAAKKAATVASPAGKKATVKATPTKKTAVSKAKKILPGFTVKKIPVVKKPTPKRAAPKAKSAPAAKKVKAK